MKTQEKPRGTRGAAYIRVSREKATGGRAEEKTSPEAQKTMIRTWCRRLGIPEPSIWYMDVEGKNSRDTWEAREDFQRMIADAEAGQWDFIIVDSHERFGAGQKAFNFYLYRLEMAGCELWSVADGNLSGEDDGTVFKVAVGNQTGTRELLKFGERQVSRKRILAAQGEWQGGWVPYGADVVCVGPDKKEKFRVVILKMVPKQGIWHRVRIWPDDRPQERFDGEGVFPVKEQHDKFFLAPSVITERVENAEDIFDQFANGAWTQRELCKRLNDRGIDPVNGEGWIVSRLGGMLKNPFYYIGQTVWGKKSHGKNAWYVGGECVIPPKVRGKPKTGRKNELSDWVFPGQAKPRKNDLGEWDFPEPDRAIPSVAIVDKATWDEVQKKLKPNSERKRGLRDPNLWLSGLVVCARCGEPMDGWTLKADKSCTHSYVCRTFRKFGGTTANKSGCRLHRVSQSLLECLINRYLEDVGPQVKLMLESREDPSLVRELHKRLGEREGELFEVYREMRAFLEGRGSKKDWDEVPVLVLYQEVFERDRADLEAELAEKEAELAEQWEKYDDELPKEATILREKATAKLVVLDAEIRELRTRLAPLTAKLEAVYADLAKLDADLDEAREALPGDNARRKAEALRRVIRAIRLNFRHFEHVCRDKRSKADTLPRSTLESVEFIPVMGGPATLLVNLDAGRNGQAATPDAGLRNEQLAGARLMTVRPAWRS